MAERGAGQARAAAAGAERGEERAGVAAPRTRVTPISTYFGYDRGTPIDRVYIEAYLARHAQDIRGRVLEVKDAAYTSKFGGARVVRSDVADIDGANPAATLVADLERPESFPAAAFDCFILTQTLHLVYDYRSALKSAERLLRPGGVLLLSCPAITQLDDWSLGQGGGDYWRFTSRAVARLLAETFPGGDIEVEAAGNVRAATAFLEGLSAEELEAEALAYFDPIYELLVLARAVKAPAG